MGESLILRSCNWCADKMFKKPGEDRASGLSCRLMRKVTGEEGIDDVCPSKGLKCCVCETEKNTSNDVWAYSVNRLESLSR